MAILIIGPSGVGKSTALKFAEKSLETLSCKILDDETTLLGKEKGLISDSEKINDLRPKLQRRSSPPNDNDFLGLGIEAVQRLERSDDLPLVVDVGAGFLDADEELLQQWFRDHTLVAVIAPAEVTFSRVKARQNEHRTLHQYERTEFSEKRWRLYATAVHTIDADCEREVLENRFIKCLKLLTRLKPRS